MTSRASQMSKTYSQAAPMQRVMQACASLWQDCDKLCILNKDMTWLLQGCDNIVEYSAHGGDSII